MMPLLVPKCPHFLLAVKPLLRHAGGDGRRGPLNDPKPVCWMLRNSSDQTDASFAGTDWARECYWQRQRLCSMRMASMRGPLLRWKHLQVNS